MVRNAAAPPPHTASAATIHARRALASLGARGLLVSGGTLGALDVCGTARGRWNTLDGSTWAKGSPHAPRSRLRGRRCANGLLSESDGSLNGSSKSLKLAASLTAGSLVATSAGAGIGSAACGSRCEGAWTDAAEGYGAGCAEGGLGPRDRSASAGYAPRGVGSSSRRSWIAAVGWIGAAVAISCEADPRTAGVGEVGVRSGARTMLPISAGLEVGRANLAAACA